MFNKVRHSRPSSNEGEGPGDRARSSGTGSKSADGGALLALVTVSTLTKYYFCAGLRPRNARHCPDFGVQGPECARQAHSWEMAEDLRNSRHTRKRPSGRGPPAYLLLQLGRVCFAHDVYSASSTKPPDGIRAVPSRARGRPGALRLTSLIPLTNWWSVAFPLYLAILREGLRLSISPKLPVV